MIKYVSPYSKSIGKTPPIPTPTNQELFQEAEKVGIKLPQ
jgi:hypothetical protein